MSNYYGWAVNPKTGITERALFADDYYGRHRYGVKFDDGNIYPIESVEVKNEPERPKARNGEHSFS